ncbi:unnamed protein product [Brugia timori]|uniref:Uncharacterized protein n=1 Tax=Brugia timori TaxID=42155 RepID=A0A0R3R7G4_9BILA|nr:unnamed protein product [Brugia timori]
MKSICLSRYCIICLSYSYNCFITNTSQVSKFLSHLQRKMVQTSDLEYGLNDG